MARSGRLGTKSWTGPSPSRFHGKASSASRTRRGLFHEARAAAQLQHSNIVSVHEVGRDSGSIYIVSDYIRGVTLDDWLSGRHPTTHESAALCRTIANALHHAHEAGVVHRDLKPANIMMDGDDEPHLMDFGLARRDTEGLTVTHDGQIMGTPAYMSPERRGGTSIKQTDEATSTH